MLGKQRLQMTYFDITLDNGKRVLCTSDHPYMLRNGEYKKAKELKEGDSLMPLYMEEKKKIYKRKSKNEKIRVDDVFHTT